ncbi:hypothetical protein [Poseidonibacter lekithochrous]|uniref:hypothetical protein n=1 Tax=Poseidonibacter lekithochrous TaxID=1904463 RepID=UPI000A8B7DD5|nr:hypothetical protein [Poseidonibacter lekithochrous]QKJ23533.1 hypothetical protein ALEK_2276 [Poseidonibacter lekithochrous]
MNLPQIIKNFKFHCEFEKTMEAYKIDLKQFEQYKNYKYLDINELDDFIYS